MQETPSDPWGATTLDVHGRLQSIRPNGETAAVATVVDVEGSAYRRSGAKMVLTADGNQLGGITAGCLEGPLRELADGVFADGTPVMETFDLMDDDEWGLGLGCNGIIDVLVEPVDDTWDPVLDALASEEPVATVTVLDAAGTTPVGARAVVDASGSVTRTADREEPPAAVMETVLDDAVNRARTGGSVTTDVVVDGGSSQTDGAVEEETVRVFLDGIEPAPKLLVFGGQPDTGPVASLARQSGFEVTVATARGGLADPERFPTADTVVSVRPQNLGTYVDDRTGVVAMSHNLLDDRLAIESVLKTEAPYVGLMGPPERFEALKDGLRQDGTDLEESDFERVATPVGLDLGGGEPAHIALSIVSEAVAVLNDRTGGQLTEQSGPIHPD